MKYDQLVHTIYDAALHPQRWPLVLQELRQSLNASAFSLFDQNPAPLGPATLLTENLDQNWVQNYRDYWWQHDAWLQQAIGRNLIQGGMTLTGTSLVDRRTLRRSHWFNDGISKQEIGDVLSTGLWSTSRDESKVILSFYRTPESEPFQAAQRKELASLNGHLTRAVAMTRQIGASIREQALQDSMLDELEQPVLLLDKHGRVLRGNPAAQQLTKLRPGLLRIKQGRLISLGVRCHPDLSQALTQARAGSIVNIALTFVDEGNAYSAGMAKLAPIKRPIQIGFETLKMSFLLVIHSNPNARAESLTAFAALYQFTPSELVVLKALLRDESPEQIAENLQVGITTIRSHLLNLRRKTGTRQIGSLIRLASQVAP